MTPKGHSPVDLESAEHATSRRSIISALGVAGLASAITLAGAKTVAAAPFSPTAADRATLEQALQLELTASRLYADALAAGLSGSAAEVAQAFGGNHRAYADQFAAITGISANTYNVAAYDARKNEFATSDVTKFATAAWELENSAAATYADLFDNFEAQQSQTVVAAIVVVNARMATVLADLAGVSDDLDLLFDPPAEIITLTEQP